MIKWIKEWYRKYHEDKVLQHFKHLCVRYKTGECPKEECPYFLRRNPFRTKACTEEELFETCPLIDFNDVTVGRYCKEIHDKYEHWQVDKGIIKKEDTEKYKRERKLLKDERKCKRNI